jgi:hypothetical protein
MNYDDDVRRQWQRYRQRDHDLVLLALMCMGLNVIVLGGLLVSMLVSR